MITTIETNTACNLNCQMCGTKHANIPPARKGFMSPVTFEMWADLAYEQGSRSISLYTIGEPLINPRLEDYLKILQDRGMFAHIQTNGLHYKAQRSTLLKYHQIISMLGWSIDSPHKATYEQIRRGARFSDLLQNLLAFRKDRHLYRRVRCDAVLMSTNKGDVAEHIGVFSRYFPISEIYHNPLNSLSANPGFFPSHAVFASHIQPMEPCLNESIILLDGTPTKCCRQYSDAPDCARCHTINPVIISLWSNLVKTRELQDGEDWDIAENQQRFDRFYSVCEKGHIPTMTEYRGCYL